MIAPLLLAGLTTSQFVTAPKPLSVTRHAAFSLTTSQFVTAPKQVYQRHITTFRLTTSQFVTAPKQRLRTSEVLTV